jgi:hypothetical protein
MSIALMAVPPRRASTHSVRQPSATVQPAVAGTATPNASAGTGHVNNTHKKK